MHTEFQAGATVRARGGRFLILSADSIAQGTGDPICRLRLRALDEPFRNEEICVLHPVEDVEPDEIPELDLAQLGRLARFQLLMDSVRLSLAPGDDRLVSSTRSRIEFEPYQQACSPGLRNGLAHYPERAGRIMLAEEPVRFETFSFGSLRIDGVTYDHDVVIDCREVRKRNKKPSKKFREEFGHTPLSLEEEIPWKCRRLMIGTGSGALPVMEEVKREANRRKIKLLILPTVEAIEELKQHPRDTNAILHITC